MPGRTTDEEPLCRWLLGEGLATLDAITGEALDVVGVLDRNLTVRYLNWATAGLTREGVTGTSALDLAPPGYRETAREAYTRVLETGIGTRFEMMYADGQVVLMWDVRVGPIRVDGAVVGLVVVTNDVTEQRREQADRDRFFSLSLDMLLVVDPQGRLKRVNPALGEILGYDVDDLVGTRFIDLVHPEDRVRTLEAFDSVLGGTPTTDFENRYRRRDGAYRVLSWRGIVDPVTGDVYSVARDVTEQRAIEAQLRQAQKMQAVGQLAGGVAHDFNNLLLAILANAELALSSSPEEAAECLGEIDGAAHRAADLVKQLLAFSRRQPFRPAPVAINDLCRGLMKMLRRSLPENIAIDLITGHDLPAVRADPSQLEQVIVNLCVNARDAMPNGGRLTLESETVLINGRYRELHPWAKPGRYVLLSVTDTGSGMTAEVRERAFEPFFTTKSPHQGTGLGLSTVYGIVEQHGGLVHVYSELGEGTTFKVYLPVADRVETDVGSKIEAQPSRSKETILLAEDEDRVRKVVVRILERAGYRVIAAADGIEAVRLLREEPEAVHLALLDVVMPELGGPETWERMRGQHPGLRVLFTSGYADDRYLTRLPAGAEVVGKPFRTEELLQRIRRKLDE